MPGFCPWFTTYKYEVLQHIYMHRYTYHTRSEGDGERERCVYIYIYTYAQDCMGTHTHTYIYILCLYIRVYMCIYIYICMHIFVGTHARSRKSWLILRLNNELPQRNRRKLKQLPWFELTLWSAKAPPPVISSIIGCSMTARHGGNKEKRTASSTQVPKDSKGSNRKAGVSIASRVSEKGGEAKRLRKDAAAGAFWHSMDTEPGAWIDVLKENGELELPDLSESKHLANKAPQIMKLTGASQLLLKEKRILVHGGSAFKSRVAKYVNIILNKIVPDDYADNDFLRVYVSEHFADGLAEDSVVEVEQAEGVIVVIEKSSQKSTALLPGDLVEVETQPGVWGSMAKVMQATETSLTIRHSHDQRQEEMVLSRVRRARSIAIFGPRRLAAAMKIVAAFEEESTGALGALHDNPYFQGQRLGVISEELPVKADVVQRLEKSPFLKQIMLATGSSIRFFMKPAGTAEAGKSRKRSVPCVLAGGSLEERWRGLQGVKIIALGMEEKRHPTLPPALLGDARRVSIPTDMVSVVVGKRMESLLELMKSTNTATSLQWVCWDVRQRPWNVLLMNIDNVRKMIYPMRNNEKQPDLAVVVFWCLVTTPSTYTHGCRDTHRYTITWKDTQCLRQCGVTPCDVIPDTLQCSVISLWLERGEDFRV